MVTGNNTVPRPISLPPSYFHDFPTTHAESTAYIHSGFISEGFGTLEAIKRENRAKFHAQNVPKVEVMNKSYGSGLHCMTIEIEANHSLYSGIGEKFDEELNEALAIGIKLLTTP